MEEAALPIIITCYLPQMTNKADLEKIHFHNFQKHSRINNPTFVSSFVNDSLTLFTPQKSDPIEKSKATEYKSHFDPFSDKINMMSTPQVPNYAKYSKEAFERSRSYLSQYGSNLLSENLSRIANK